MLQKDNSTYKDNGESIFIKMVIAGTTLLTAITNLVIAIINLSKGLTFGFVMALVLFFVFAIVSVIAFALIKAKKNFNLKTVDAYNKIIDNISNVTHTLLHRVRDSIYYMESAYDNKEFRSAIEFEEFVTIQVLQLMDALAQELSKLAECPVRTCIKSIYYAPMHDEEISKGKIITFARSGLINIDDIMYEHTQPISIEENTDFLKIVTNEKNTRQKQFFFEKNLVEYDKKLRENEDEYRNTNNAWKDDYITTIVCPIRLKRRESENGEIQYYDLVGFLCADSKDEKAFDKETQSFCLDIMKGIADILYVYLDRFIDYYAQMTEEIGV